MGLSVWVRVGGWMGECACVRACLHVRVRLRVRERENVRTCVFVCVCVRFVYFWVVDFSHYPFVCFKRIRKVPLLAFGEPHLQWLSMTSQSFK